MCSRAWGAFLQLPGLFLEFHDELLEHAAHLGHDVGAGSARLDDAHGVFLEGVELAVLPFAVPLHGADDHVHLVDQLGGGPLLLGQGFLQLQGADGLHDVHVEHGHHGLKVLLGEIALGQFGLDVVLNLCLFLIGVDREAGQEVAHEQDHGDPVGVVGHAETRQDRLQFVHGGVSLVWRHACLPYPWAGPVVALPCCKP